MFSKWPDTFRTGFDMNDIKYLHNICQIQVVIGMIIKTVFIRVVNPYSLVYSLKKVFFRLASLQFRETFYERITASRTAKQLPSLVRSIFVVSPLASLIIQLKYATIVEWHLRHQWHYVSPEQIRRQGRGRENEGWIILISTKGRNSVCSLNVPLKQPVSST